MGAAHGSPAQSPGASRRARRGTLRKLFSIMFCSALALQTPLAGASATLAYADAAQGGASFTVVEEDADGATGAAQEAGSAGAGAPSGGMAVEEDPAGGAGAEADAAGATDEAGEAGAGTTAPAETVTATEASSEAPAAAAQATPAADTTGATEAEALPSASLYAVAGELGLEYAGVSLSGVAAPCTLRAYAQGAGTLYPAIAGSAWSQAAGGTYPYAEVAVEGDGDYALEGVQLASLRAVSLVAADGTETVLLDAQGVQDALAAVPAPSSYAQQGSVTVGPYTNEYMGESSIGGVWSYPYAEYSSGEGAGWFVQCVSPTASAAYSSPKDTTLWVSDESVAFMEYVVSRGYVDSLGWGVVGSDDAGYQALQALAAKVYVPGDDATKKSYAAEHLVLSAALQVLVAHGTSAFEAADPAGTEMGSWLWDATCSAMAGYNDYQGCEVYVSISPDLGWNDSNSAIAECALAMWRAYRADAGCMRGITVQSFVGFSGGATSYDSAGQHVFAYRVSGKHTEPEPEPEKGAVELVKASARPEVTDGNGCYSLEGAVYGVYSDNACRTQVDALTTDGTGYAKSGELAAGTYYVKETKPSMGYAKDATVYEVKVEAGKTARVGGDGATVKEPVQNDPLPVQVQKIDAENGEPVAVGDGSLKGAQFTIKYYAGSYGLDTLPAEATRTWVVETNAKGRAALLPDYLVTSASDELYKFGDTYGIPLGTVTVQETKAPEGYNMVESDVRIFNIDADGSGTETVTQDLTATFSEVSAAGGVSLQKRASGPLPEGADLSGIVFGVYNSSKAAVTVGGVAYEPVTAEQVASGEAQPVLTLETDADGFATTDADGDGRDLSLPYGTYTVHEISVPDGSPVTVSAPDQTVEVRSHGEVAACAEPFTDELARAGLAVRKVDADTGEARAQGSATLEGAAFEVRDASGAVVAALVTDGVGYAATAADALPLGTYTVTEVAPPDGYGLPEAASQTVTLSAPGEVAELDEPFADPVLRGGVGVQKVDADTGEASPQGGATLGGAAFEVYNATGADVVVGGVTYASADPDRLDAQVASGEVKAVASLETDADGYAATAADALPLGNYLVREVRSPEGYKVNGDVFEVEVAAGEVAVAGVPAGDFGAAVPEQVQRGDVRLVKVRESDMGRLAGVPFLLKSEDTGEEHVVVTDANGCIDTSSIAPDRRTNANDAAVKGGEADASKLDAREGVWFGEGAPAEGLGSLPYGDYTITELSVPANAGLKLVSFGFKVYRDEAVVDLGTVDDKASPALGSELLVAADGSHEAYAGGTQALTDTVEYANLPQGDYRAVLTLVLLPEGEGGQEAELASAETTFSTVKGYGEYAISYDLDTSSLAGRSVVAYEEVFDSTGASVASHKDPKDADQTVRFLAVPEVGTTLAGAGGEKVVAPAEGKATLVDTVAYRGLAADGRAYAVTGTLYDKATGEAILDADGKAVTASATFTPESADGEVQVTFEADASLVSGKAVVAFESLSQGGRELAAHADISDEGQTAWVPEVGTTLSGAAPGLHLAAPSAKASLTDTVAYRGLRPGEEYSVTGTLYDKATEKPLEGADGQAVTASATFTPESADGEVQVTFELDAASLAGRTVVAFESVSLGGREVAAHADLGDGGQTVRFPALSTTFATASGSHVVSGSEPVDLADTVGLSNLEPGRTYNLFLTLQDAGTHEELRRSDGTRVEASAQFTPEGESAEVAVELKGLTPEWAGSAVAMEDLYALADDGQTWVLVGGHRDPSDTAQAVSWGTPVLRTTLASAETGLGEVGEGESVRLTDTVEYDGLEAGAEHVLTGTLRYADTGEAVLGADGEELTSTVAFTPEEAKGTVEVPFTVDTSALGGRALVAFESAAVDGREVASHADLSDSDQTVRVVSVRTTATDASDGDHEVEAAASARLADRVELKGLEPGATYTIETELADSETHEVLASSSADVAPSKADTAYTVTCEVDTSKLAGRDLVFLETLKRDGKTVAEHRDWSDVGQTVRVSPWIGTTLTERSTGYHETAPGQVTLVDTVAYHGLTRLNVPYTLTGELRYADGRAVAGPDGKALTATATFTPTSSEGTAAVEFALDASGVADGTKVVAFETLSDANGRTAAEHKDLSDADQTVTFRVPSTPTTTTTTTTATSMPQTGQGLGWAAALALGALAAFAGGFYFATGRLPLPARLRRRDPEGPAE